MNFIKKHILTIIGGIFTLGAFVLEEVEKQKNVQDTVESMQSEIEKNVLASIEAKYVVKQ